MSERVEVEFLLDMLEHAFRRPLDAHWADGWHSLLVNLQNVRNEDWEWLPPDGVRTISHLTLHCGAALRMYANYGFGDGTLQWPGAVPEGETSLTKESLVPWLTESYEVLRDGLATCSDVDLGEPRKTHFGLEKPRRWFAHTMIEHTIYHAGEINYIRALAQKNDK